MAKSPYAGFATSQQTYSSSSSPIRSSSSDVAIDVLAPQQSSSSSSSLFDQSASNRVSFQHPRASVSSSTTGGDTSDATSSNSPSRSFFGFNRKKSAATPLAEDHVSHQSRPVALMAVLVSKLRDQSVATTSRRSLSRASRMLSTGDRGSSGGQNNDSLTSAFMEERMSSV